jgi:hypothetical protein
MIVGVKSRYHSLTLGTGVSSVMVAWLLKNSIFLKTAEISGIQNCLGKRERRL